MKKETYIEVILDSLEGVQRAEAKPFMYTRVKARMQKDEANFWYKAGSFVAKPVIAICCILAIVATNVYFIVDSSKKEPEETSVAIGSDSDILQNENFILASNTSYDFNN